MIETEIEDGATAPTGGEPDWQTVVAERMTREDIAKEDGRYLMYYRFEPPGEA